MIKTINKALIINLAEEAKRTERKRKNLNYHQSFNDPINRMLNAIEPGSYIQPHKHENPDKREVFFLLQGSFVVVFFNDSGNIIDHVILDNIENYGVEIPPAVWHTIISLEPGSVVYVVKDGPYSEKDDKNFAAWAPTEGDKNCTEYLKQLLSQLKLV